MIKNIDCTNLKTKLDSKAELMLIDCREQDEWDSGHIEGANFHPLSTFEEYASELTDKNVEIIIQCRSGARSMKACQLLDSLGFTNISNLDGGILNWAECQFPITTK